MADLSSILGGMVQGFKDFGTGLVDLFGTGGAAIGDAISSIQTGRATTKNQDDFRKWLYNTDSTKDAAAKGLGTALNGVSTVADVIPGAQAVTANPLFNGLQGAIGGISDELKMAGENADWGKAAQRAGVGAASGLASGYAGQALGKSGNKLLSNGLTRGAVSGALGGGIANAGYTGIEGGSVQDMINAGLYGAQTGALVGGTTGLARELIKPNHKMDVALTDEEKAARIANIDDQLGKLDLNTPEGNARYNELALQRQQYSGNKRLYRGLGQEYDPNYPKNKLDTQGYESWTDNPELARQYGENVYYIDVPEGDIKTSYLDENPMSETYGDRNPIYSIDKKAGLNGVSGNEYLLSVDDPYKEGLTYNKLGGKPKTVADLMNEPKQKTVADLMLSPEQEEFFKNSKLRDENGKLVKMYHGTPDGSFTEFNEGSYFTPNKEYADGYQWEGASVLRSNKKAVNPKTYEVYINTEKPFTLSDPKARDIYLNEYIKGGNSMYYDPYTDWTKAVNELSEVDWTEGEDLRAWLKENHPEYDALYLDEGGDGGYGEAEYKWRGNSVVPFNANQIKDINNLRPTADADIMYSKVPEGQLGLFDQPMPTKPVDEALTLDGKYSPKDNKVTKAMRARAEEIMGDYKTSKKVPENELYNKIDESTLPNKRKSTGAILDDLYSKGIKPDEVSNKVLDQLVEKEIGGKMDKKGLATYLFGDMDDTARKDFIKKNLYTTKDYDVDDLTESILKNWARRKAMASGTLNKYNIDNLAIVGGNKTVRQGYTGALDSALSERLGIAPGNTYKQNGEFDTPGALGRYIGSESRPDFNNYMVKEVPDIEEALNTAGHERLHSFQAESRLENRYSKEVADAYNGLASDLKKANAYKSDAEIKNRYEKGTEYWSDTDEQEARMLQQYLGARGFTDYNKRDAKMYGALEFDNDKIVPAFDKFFEKLRALSKKGVALPALTALFGGGAIAGALTSGKDDKKKKSEVK